MHLKNHSKNKDANSSRKTNNVCCSSREKEIVYGYWFSGFSKFTYYLYIEMAT